MSERLFEPFVDAIDGTACVSASATLAEIEALCAPHRLRFPLILDAKATLRDHVEAATHAPASHRFGPFCDNILGMNWRLPSGKAVRIGERVAKTTTGYDWLRFLLHTGNRFGEPLDYVIRLRPDCGFTMVAEFSAEEMWSRPSGRQDLAEAPDCRTSKSPGVMGSTRPAQLGGLKPVTTSPQPRDGLRAVVHQLLHSGWMHWWDSVDYICRDGTKHVRVIVHTPREEAPIFETELRRVASSTSTHVEVKHDSEAPHDGLPDATIKTTPDRVLELAHCFPGEGYSRALARQRSEDSSRIDNVVIESSPGGLKPGNTLRCVGLCYCGVVHATGNDVERVCNSSTGVAGFQPAIDELETRQTSLRVENSFYESAWLTTLEQALHER